MPGEQIHRCHNKSAEPQGTDPVAIPAESVRNSTGIGFALVLPDRFGLNNKKAFGILAPDRSETVRVTVPETVHVGFDGGPTREPAF